MKNIKRYRKFVFMLVLAIAFMAFLFVPFDLVISPERKLTVVDQMGKPIAQAEVWQVWHQYSLGLSGDEINKTDANGTIHLPEHSVNTNVISILFGALREFRLVGLHASYSSSEEISIRINSQSIEYYYDGKGLESGHVIINQ